MSQIQKRMEALGVKQVDMILELRKRGSCFLAFACNFLYIGKSLL